MLVHGPRHAEVGELDGARRVDEAVPGMGGGGRDRRSFEFAAKKVYFGREKL